MMTRQEFVQLLRENNINERILFDGELGDGSGVRKNRTGWEVYHQERGIVYESVGFPSESDALLYLYEHLLEIYIRIYGKPINQE